MWRKLTSGSGERQSHVTRMFRSGELDGHFALASRLYGEYKRQLQSSGFKRSLPIWQILRISSETRLRV